MTKLQELYAKRKQLESKEPNGMASAILRHNKIANLQREIDYYERGEVISRAEIQEALKDIRSLQQEADRLQAKVAEKRSSLMASVFGEYETT